MTTKYTYSLQFPVTSDNAATDVTAEEFWTAIRLYLHSITEGEIGTATTLLQSQVLPSGTPTPVEFATVAYVDAQNAAQGTGPFLPLSQVPTASVVNVLDHGAMGDGTTLDTIAIQAVLNAYAGKATVYIPDTGTPYVIATSPNIYGLSLPSGTDLLLDGTLKLLAGYMLAGNGILNVNGSSRVTIRGRGTLDGNVASGAVCAGISTGNSSNLGISGITIQNTFYWGMNITSTNHVRVDNVTVTGFGASNEFAVGCDDCWITNSTIDGSDGKDAGFTFYGGVTNSGAIGNTIRNCGLNGSLANLGLSVLADGTSGVGTGVGCSNIIMADNICHNNGASGIWVDVHTVAVHTGIIITGNRCYNNCLFGGDSADIHAGNSNNVTITGNQSQGCRAPWGIFISGGAGGAVGGYNVSDNHVLDSAFGATGGEGLHVDFVNYAMVSGNYFYNLVGGMTVSMGGNAGLQAAFLNNFSNLSETIVYQPDTVVVGAGVGNVYRVGAGTTFSTRNPSQLLNNAGTAVRWYVGVDSATESGVGNDGSGFFIERVSDNNTGIDTPLAIARATGTTTLTSLAVSGNSGFYNTSPIAKPTGVAVTAEGIHAALVSLGLIAA